MAEMLLRLSHDMRFISHAAWARSLELSDVLGKQAGGWRKQSQRAHQGELGFTASVA